MERTIVAVFDTYEEAINARQDLLDTGFSPGEIDIERHETTTGATTTGEPEHGGFMEGLRNFFLGEDRDYYEEASRRGHSVLTVTSSEARVDRACDILSRHNPVDLDKRAEEWRKSGWSGAGYGHLTTAGEPMGATGAPRETGKTRETGTTRPTGKAGEEESIPVVEEQLHVGKQREVRGGVRIYSRVTETPVEQDVTLREETVDVQRRKADRPASAGDIREQTVEMTEMREEPVVRKEARVVEEVVLRKDVKERKQTVKDKVRKTEVEVQDLDKNFRHDFEQRYAGRGYTYDQSRAAYHYGNDLAEDPRYRGKSWTQVEPEARRLFEERNPGLWDEFKDAVRSAYERTRERKAA